MLNIFWFKLAILAGLLKSTNILIISDQCKRGDQSGRG